MSIENKLIYLNTTKEKLKDSINNIGGSITDETTFRAYATELDNIYTSLPKTTGEGSNLSLNTLKGRINVDDILGDTTQEGTPTPSSPQDINVVTGTQEVVVQNRNLISGGVEFGKYSDITGVKIDDNSTYRNAEIISIRPSTTYTFSINGTTQGINKFYYDENKNFIEKVSDTNGTFTTPNNAYYLNVFRGTSAGNTGWQLNYGSTALPYIEHQEQTKTLHLSSSNLCNLNFNSSTIAGVTLTKNNDNTITANGTATSTIAVNILNNNGGTSTDNLILPKGTYTLSGCPSGGGTNTNYKLDLVRNNGPLITDTGTSATYTATSDIAYSGIRIVIYSGTTCDNLIFKPMLNEGSTALPYEPYYNYELAKIGTYQDRIFETSGKNKLKNNATTRTIRGVTFTKYDDGSVKVSGTATGNIQYDLLTSNDNIQISSGNYYLSGCPSGGTSETYRLVICVNGTLYGEYGSGRALTLSSGVLTSYIYLASGTSVNNLIYKPMLNKGSAALPYEPYGSDKWYIEKNIGKVLLKDVPQGTNNWTKSNAYSTNDYFCGFCGFASIKTNSYYILCNKLINAIYSDTTTSECIANDSESVNLKIKASRLSENSPTGLANYLANEGSDIYIIYILKTPTITEITDTTLTAELNELEKMMSYNGQTNISVSGNLPMILDITALKGE